MCLLPMQHGVIFLLFWPLRAAVSWTGVVLGELEMEVLRRRRWELAPQLSLRSLSQGQQWEHPRC